MMREWTAGVLLGLAVAAPGSAAAQFPPDSVMESEDGVRNLFNGMRWRIRSVAESPEGYPYLGVDQGLLVRLVPA
ncbi:MAG TPA: hypothetical protein VJ997_11240 [Longimicrobiales bacterium]|nr:hypothetical protein [Longimicrobiales bacterium]